MLRVELETRGKCLNAMINSIDDMYSSKKSLDTKTRKQYYAMLKELNKLNIELINNEYPEIYEQLLIVGFKEQSEKSKKN